jgi:hypothetical protein
VCLRCTRWMEKHGRLLLQTEHVSSHRCCVFGIGGCVCVLADVYNCGYASLHQYNPTLAVQSYSSMLQCLSVVGDCGALKPYLHICYTHVDGDVVVMA